MLGHVPVHSHRPFLSVAFPAILTEAPRANNVVGPACVNRLAACHPTIGVPPCGAACILTDPKPGGIALLAGTLPNAVIATIAHPAGIGIEISRATTSSRSLNTAPPRVRNAIRAAQTPRTAIVP